MLCTALEEIHSLGTDEYATKAAGFLSLVEQFNLFFGLKLSDLISSATEQLSISLQGVDTTIQECVRYLEVQRTDDSFNI